jgi:hypothetical protein
MAIVFELVVNFGGNRVAVDAALETLQQFPTLSLRGLDIPLMPAYVTEMKSTLGDDYIEFSVSPQGICYGGERPTDPVNARTLTSDELTNLGGQLFDLLRRFDGYDVAAVGWDPEGIVDPNEMQNEWLLDGSIYRLDGVVVSNHLAAKWGLDERFEPFVQGFRWIPYRGSKP